MQTKNKNKKGNRKGHDRQQGNEIMWSLNQPANDAEGTIIAHKKNGCLAGTIIAHKSYPTPHITSLDTNINLHNQNTKQNVLIKEHEKQNNRQIQIQSKMYS